MAAFDVLLLRPSVICVAGGVSGGGGELPKNLFMGALGPKMHLSFATKSHTMEMECRRHVPRSSNQRHNPAGLVFALYVYNLLLQPTPIVYARPTDDTPMQGTLSEGFYLRLDCISAQRTMRQLHPIRTTRTDAKMFTG